jgi:hypothetical protein
MLRIAWEDAYLAIAVDIGVEQHLSRRVGTLAGLGCEVCSGLRHRLRAVAEWAGWARYSAKESRLLHLPCHHVSRAAMVSTGRTTPPHS